MRYTSKTAIGCIILGSCLYLGSKQFHFSAPARGLKPIWLYIGRGVLYIPTRESKTLEKLTVNSFRNGAIMGYSTRY